jgi:magnesium chelatase family protein
MALAVLAAAAVIDPLPKLAAVGELGLDGSVRPVAGIVPIAAAIDDEVVIVPAANAADAALVAGSRVRAVQCLADVLEALGGRAAWPEADHQPLRVTPAGPDLADVRGQPVARFALEVAAAGGHHLLMVGSPGAGKTMLAERLVGLLPDLAADEALEVMMAHSVAQTATLGDGVGLVTRPPFRSPHHSVTMAALLGGGTAAMRPGEVALAHRGVLFLDELGEFAPSVLDGLRQPLERGIVRVDRAAGSAEYPAAFLLVAAMNPCPCGAEPERGCRCSEAERARYQRRLSGPLLDRFDLRFLVRRPDADALVDGPPAEATVAVAARVARARARARSRGVAVNAAITSADLSRMAPISEVAARLLRQELVAGRLTGRGLHRVRRVARTIADLRGDDEVVDVEAVAAALALRADPLRGGR